MRNLRNGIRLDDQAMTNAVESGRSQSDCPVGEFITSDEIYRTQFGSEAKDYSLDN